MQLGVGMGITHGAKAPAAAVVCSYDNPGGTGDRRRYVTATTDLSLGHSSGTIKVLITGTTGTSSAHAIWFNDQAVSGKYIQFAFTEALVIQEAKWYQDLTTAHGTWKWQGSQNASDWTDIGSSFTLGGATTQTQTELSGNTAAYLYYRLLGVSGNASGNSWDQEIEFKIGPTSRSNGCLYTNAGGTGDRTASVTATSAADLIDAASSAVKLVNGSLAESTAGSCSFIISTAAAGKWIQFDFGSAKLIDQAAWWQSRAESHGTWKWQGSANGSDWTDIGASFTLGGAADVTLHTELGGNTTSYRYYRLLGVSGTVSNLPWLEEIEFRIGS